MEKKIKWIYNFFNKNYKASRYLLVCSDKTEGLEEISHYSAVRVIDFETKQEAIDWIDLNVPKIDREYYFIYKLLSRK